MYIIYELTNAPNAKAFFIYLYDIIYGTYIFTHIHLKMACLSITNDVVYKILSISILIKNERSNFSLTLHLSNLSDSAVIIKSLQI